MNTIIFLTLSGESNFLTLYVWRCLLLHFILFVHPCSVKGLKIMNLGDAKARDGVAAVLQEDDDDAVDPHLERIRNEAGGDESDEEVSFDLFSTAIRDSLSIVVNTRPTVHFT